MSDVNITPLVDVCLVLLISFMITVPMLAHGFEVQLPRTRAARQMPARQDRPPVVISVPKTNNLKPRLDDITVRPRCCGPTPPCRRPDDVRCISGPTRTCATRS
jgi:biopolymer transport protein ExbD